MPDALEILKTRRSIKPREMAPAARVDEATPPDVKRVNAAV